MAFLVLINDFSGCEISLKFWLFVMVLQMAIETMLQELRERINFSDYWRERPKMKKAIVIAPIVLRELCEFGWLIYGNILYFSEEAGSCNEK